jgi:hypothetical protein
MRLAEHSSHDGSLACRVLVAAAAVLVLVSCSRRAAQRGASQGEPSPVPAPSPVSHAQAVPSSVPSPCKLVTPATARAALGGEVKPPRDEPVSTGFVAGRRCLYLTAAPIEKAGGTGSLDLEVFDSASMASADTLFKSPADYFDREYTAIKTTSGKVEDLSGLGDRAFWEPGGQMLHVLSGGVYVQLQIKNLARLSAASAADLDAELTQHRRKLSLDLMRQQVLPALRRR